MLVSSVLAGQIPNRLLFVDDEQDIVTYTKRGLEKHGFQVDGYSDPLQALEHFKPSYYDRIIVDVRMPIMNGFELARAIHSKDKNAKVCFFTSFEILEDEAKKVFSNLPSYCFIKKPIGMRELAEHIRTHDDSTKLG